MPTYDPSMGVEGFRVWAADAAGYGVQLGTGIAVVVLALGMVVVFALGALVVLGYRR